MAEEEGSRTLKRQKLGEETFPQDGEEEEEGEEDYGEEGDGEGEEEEGEDYDAELTEDEESRLLRAAMMKVEEFQAELEKVIRI